jgi:hypothetical protein
LTIVCLVGLFHLAMILSVFELQLLITPMTSSNYFLHYHDLFLSLSRNLLWSFWPLPRVTRHVPHMLWKRQLNYPCSLLKRGRNFPGWRKTIVFITTRVFGIQYMYVGAYVVPVVDRCNKMFIVYNSGFHDNVISKIIKSRKGLFSDNSVVSTTTNPSAAHEFTNILSLVRVVRCIVFCVVFCWPLFVLLD